MAQNQFEVDIKLGLDKSVQVLDSEIEKIDQQLLKATEKMNKRFEKSIKGKNLSMSEKFAARDEYVKSHTTASAQQMQEKRAALSSQRDKAKSMIGDMGAIASGNESLGTIGSYISKRIDFLKSLDTLVSQYSKQITEFQPAIVTAEKIKQKQESKVASSRKASSKPDYKAMTIAARGISEEQYNKEQSDLSQKLATAQEGLKEPQDKKSKEKAALFKDIMRQIAQSQKKSSMSDEEYKNILPQIEKDVRNYVEQTYAGKEKTLAGSNGWRKKIKVRGFQEGFEKNAEGQYVDAKGNVVKGTNTSVLRASAFAPFITKEGEYVSASNAEGGLKKSVRVYDPRLANSENVGGVGDLRNKTFTGLEKAFLTLTTKAQELSASGQAGGEEYQKIESLISLIPQVIKDAYANTSSKDVKTLFEDSLTNMKGGVTALDAEETSVGGFFNRDSELASTVRNLVGLRGKASKMQRGDIGDLPEAPTPDKTDRTDDKQTRRDQISNKQKSVIDQKHKDETWESIKGSKETTYDKNGNVLQVGIKDFLSSLSGSSDQLKDAVLALAEQILSTTNIDIDSKQQMEEVISKQSLNAPITYRDEEGNETMEAAVSGQSSAKYQAHLEEQRRKQAGRLDEGFQRLQSAIAYNQTESNGTAAITKATERIYWLADILDEINQGELAGSLRKVAEGNTRFKEMDPNTIANSISKIYAYPEALDASLSHNLTSLNESRAAQGLKPIKEEKFRKNFFKENPEIEQKYNESKAAKDRYDSVGSDSVGDKLAAFFSVVGQSEEGVNKFVTVLAKAYEHLNGTISRVKNIDGEEVRATASAKRWVEDIVDYRVGGTTINPNQGINGVYYAKEGITGQDVNWEEITDNPSPALVTNLENKAGLTGNIYGGNTPQENADIAKSILEKKKKELERVKALVANPKSEAGKNKNLKRIQEIQAEIDYHYKNWDELMLSQTPVVYSSKKKTDVDDFNTPAETPVDPEIERVQNLRESLKQTGLSKGASFSAKNSIRRTFGGKITDITGQGKNQIVEALLEDGSKVKYTLEGLLGQLVTYAEQAEQQVSDTSEKIKQDITQDTQQATTAVDNSTANIDSKTGANSVANTDVQNKTGDASTELAKEEQAVENVNAALEEHETEVLSAAEAEKQKVLVSKDLVKQLAKEEEAFEQTGESAKNAETQQGVTYEYKDLKSYDDTTHTYTDTEGRKLRSLTQLGGALKGLTPSESASNDEKAFMNAIAAIPKGKQLTAEDVGMTAQDFAKKKNAVISREKGNLEHEVIDLLSKTGASDVSGFARKQVEVKWNGETEVVDAQEQYARVLREKSELLSKLGVDNASELLNQAVQSYTQALDNAHVLLTPFSETPMAATFNGPKGKFDYSFTPDQIAKGEDGSNYILDTKTGKTYGTESFQLAGQLYGILANAQNPKFQQLYQDSDISTDKDFSLYIADVKDGFTQLIKHMALSEEEFYDLLVRANDIIDGNAEPLTKDEQISLMNREMKTGRYFGHSQQPLSEKPVDNSFVSYAPNENGGVDKREQAVINAYVGEYQKLVTLQTELKNLEEQKNVLAQNGVNFTQDEAVALQKQIDKQNEAIKAQRDVMSERGLTISDVDGNFAIGKTLLSDKGNEDLQAKINRINSKSNVRAAKNSSGTTTATNASQTRDLKLQMDNYKELLSLQNKLKESNLKVGGLTGEKQARQQEESAQLQKQIEQLQQILTINGQIVDEKTLEKEITEATYLTENEKKENLNNLRKATNEAARTSANIDTKYSQSAQNNNPNLQEAMQGYFRNLEEQGKLDREIARARNKGQSLTGNAAIENQSFINSLEAQKQSLANQYKYDAQKRTLNDMELTEEQINKLEQKRTEILNNNQLEMDKMGASVNQTKGFLTQLKDNFKQSFQEIGYAIMQVFSFQQLQQLFSSFINSVEQLDQKMVDLQIASGYTRKELKGMMSEFNDLAMEIGKTTQEVAEAANDWLRAGYSGQQAAQLTEASMELSTLGMINSADATSYLISVLKGWKLEANDVQGVVDKLTAVDMQAAISAGDLAEAMSRASNSAQMAGSTLDRYIGYLTTITDVTQKSAASVGES